MELRYRPMRPGDICKRVEHFAAHPILGPRYGRLIEFLPLALTHALDRDLPTPVVYEELLGSATRLIGIGLRAFVSDEFVREMKATPNFWVGPELVDRIRSGKSPLLSDAEVRNTNSTTGLNLVAWHNSSYPEDLRKATVGTLAMTAFEENYRGFRLRELVGQADCLEHLYAMRNAGLLYFDQLQGRYTDFPEVNAQNFGDKPRNVGMPRDQALTYGGSWLGSLFLYAPPQLGLSRGEQRLLVSALAGGTDRNLSDELGVSLSAVKQTWRKIYSRVGKSLPDLVPHESESAFGRGRQKKQQLLAYLREHPEELRPISRKLLFQQSARSRFAPACLRASAR
jgi:hypothetical protein